MNDTVANPGDAARALLSTPGTTLARTLGALKTLEPLLPAERQTSLGLSSNVNIDLLATYLRKQGVLAGTRVTACTGSHDDVLGDLARFTAAGLQSMVYLPFFDNLLPAFEQQIVHLPPEQIDDLEQSLRQRWHLLFSQAGALRYLLVGTLHRLGTAVDTGVPDPVQAVLDRFNAALREEAAPHRSVRLIDTEAIVRQLGLRSAVDLRFYLRSTTPYTAAFLDELAQRVAQATRGFDTHYYKALVLDCDNTLWGGIVGEDGPDGIAIDPHSYPGRVFWRAQLDFLALERQGVLLCLCSKNNAADVDEVLVHHPGMVLRPQHIATARVNWDDKASNLRAIAQQLNIGLDSLVFVDDSAFECESVRSALPMVQVLQVPAQPSDYAQLTHTLKSMFLAGGVSAESRDKTAQYRQRDAAEQARSQFASHEDYLASLQLSVAIACNDEANVDRISELTQKSNQFNLTTLRQSPADILQRMRQADRWVLSLTVADRFGSAGLTGVVLARKLEQTLVIDALLMSCRVIGRGVEFALWPALVDLAAAQGCHAIEARYIASRKNAQVADFYDRAGLALHNDQPDHKVYRQLLADFQPKTIAWIQVTT